MPGRLQKRKYILRMLVMEYQSASADQCLLILVVRLVSKHRQWVEHHTCSAWLKMHLLMVTCYIMLHTIHTVQIIHTCVAEGAQKAAGQPLVCKQKRFLIPRPHA